MGMQYIKNNNLIVFSLVILAFLAMGTITFAPKNAQADACTIQWVNNQYVGNCNVSNGYTDNYNYNNYNNPTPIIYSISPNHVGRGIGSITISINGNNFIQSSVVKWNGSNRNTTYLNPSLLTVQLSSYDLSNSGTNSITVFNSGASNGGLSNTINFTVDNSYYVNGNTQNNNSSSTRNYRNTNSSTTSTTTSNDTSNTSNASDNNNAGSLAANALYGTKENGFLPSSLLQWIFFIILVLLAIVLWRRVYLANREPTPLKHA
jgi:hypothetical protein